MAQLTGINKRTEVNYIEVVSDDKGTVLVIIRDDDGVRLQARKPHETRYGMTGPRFSLAQRDATFLATVFNDGDFGWQEARIKEIGTETFSLPDPEPGVDAAEQARCAELDIERAKAANLAEQRELLLLELVRDHTLDKHLTAYVEGCTKCEDAVNNVLAGRTDLEPLPDDAPDF